MDDLNILWQKVQKKFSENNGEEITKQLLGKSRPVKLENFSLQIIVINQLMKNMLISRQKEIENILQEITNETIKISVDALETNTTLFDTNEISPLNVKENNQNNYNIFENHLDKKFTFENFVVGNNSRMTHAAALQVAENPGKGYNPLFIYGKPGLGKTHLIQAIGNKVIEKNKNAKVFYTTTEEFVNDVVNAIHNHTTDALHKKYRSLDCLIIDDIQLLKGKEATQEEFFNTFNALDNAHKQIIIACDRPPQEIKTLEERITSRLARGFLGDIQEPDFETRLAILKVKLHERNIVLDNECMNLVAASITSDIRLLESVCNNLKLLSDIGEKITQKRVMEIIEKHGTKVKHEGINFEEILLQVSEYYGLKKEDILSKRRDAKVNEPRQIVMYITRKLTGLTFDEIGKELGGRDHSTIMNGYEKIYKAINSKDKKISITVSTLIKKLEN